MAKTVVGLFDDFNEAQSVVQELVGRGFNRDQISLAANEHARNLTMGQAGEPSKADANLQAAGSGDTGHMSTGDAAGAGATAGTVVGGIGGLLVGLGLLAIPGVGPLVAAGPLLATITGAGIGAAAGGLIGALTHLGVPREEAEYYNEGVRRGGTLVTINAPDDRADEAADIMNSFGAVDIDQRGAALREGGFAGYDEGATAYNPDQIRAERDRLRATGAPRADVSASANAGETAIPIIEEELQVGKRQVQGGGARVHTFVTESPVQQDVQLHEEQVHVERRPVNRPATDADMSGFREGVMEVTETSEEAVVGKQARVVEEVVINKTAGDRTQTINDTVRRTGVDVENLDEAARANRTGRVDAQGRPIDAVVDVNDTGAPLDDARNRADSDVADTETYLDRENATSASGATEGSTLADTTRSTR